MNARGMWLMATGMMVAGALAQEPAPPPAGATIDVEQAKTKVMARRAAEADAYRKLAECIKGLHITSMRVPAERERPDRSNVNAWIGAT